jgi:SSS family solute:Na+ symporter
VAAAKFDKTPSPADGLLLNHNNQLQYVTLAVGSALALFLYPHSLTGVLAARNRNTIKRNMSALPAYSLLLGLIALLGYLAIAAKITPIGADPAAGKPGDRNTVIPLLFDQVAPHWFAGIAFAAIGIAALVPAAIMSIGAANLFTRNVYREFLNPRATPAQEARVSKLASLLVKLGAVACILFLDPQFSVDLQLIGGVLILQTLPAVALGLYGRWLRRWGLVAGLLAGLATGLLMLYQTPQLGGPKGTTVLREHFGGSAWALSHLGIDTKMTVYAGFLAVLVNLVVAALATLILRVVAAPDGQDSTRPSDYTADEGDPHLQELPELLDGDPVPSPVASIR